MAAGRFKIVSLPNGNRPLRGQDVQITVEGPGGVELLVPAMSLVLKVNGRHELATAIIEVPVVLVSLEGIPLDQAKVIGDTIPSADVEKVFGEALGANEDIAFAAPEHYAEAERGTVERLPPRGAQSAWEAQTAAPRPPVVQTPGATVAGGDPYAHLLQVPPAAVVPYRAAPLAASGPDPLAELDRVIARGGVVDG